MALGLVPCRCCECVVLDFRLWGLVFWGPFVWAFSRVFGDLGGVCLWAGSPVGLGRAYPSCLALQEQGKTTSGATVDEAWQPGCS